MTPNTLQYIDERDKTYGIAGMAITLVALDAEKYFDGIDLDSPTGEYIIMSNDYGFRGNPRMSAKIIWEQTLRELRLSASLALGNLACRRYILARKALAADEIAALREALRYDANEHLDMDSDEADNLFENCRQYADRIFRHHSVAPIAHSFASKLTERHRMSAQEAIEILASLGLQ